MDPVEKRERNRINWRGSVHLIVPTGERMEATITDISESGWGVRTEKPLSAGVRVEIDGTGFQGSGVVRYSYPHHGAYRVGIELAPAA